MTPPTSYISGDMHVCHLSVQVEVWQDVMNLEEILLNVFVRAYIHKNEIDNMLQ